MVPRCAFGNPDVTRAFGVVNPGEAISRGGGDQISRERRTEHLLNCKRAVSDSATSGRTGTPADASLGIRISSSAATCLIVCIREPPRKQ